MSGIISTPRHTNPFESSRRLAEDGTEYWSSRDLSAILGYADYRNFEQAIARAKEACAKSGHRIQDHFGESTDMVEIGSGTKRPVAVVFLSRYACYLVVQNADPAKPIVAAGQTYFAVQTRRQELADEGRLDEDHESRMRLQLREEMRRHNTALASAAKDAGVVDPLDYAIFQNHGYQGLYGGLNMRDIHTRKRLKKSEQILDHMGSTELAANLFRATQAEDKIRREKITGKDRANLAHHEVGKKVRQTIAELGGTMPENLPAVESIKRLESTGRKKELS